MSARGPMRRGKCFIASRIEENSVYGRLNGARIDGQSVLLGPELKVKVSGGDLLGPELKKNVFHWARIEGQIMIFFSVRRDYEGQSVWGGLIGARIEELKNKVSTGESELNVCIQIYIYIKNKIRG